MSRLNAINRFTSYLTKSFSFLLLLNFLLSGCLKFGPPQDPPDLKEIPMAVEIKELEYTKIVDSSEYLGFLRSKKSIDLYPKVNAYISKIHVNPGQEVSQNQLLISLDSRELSAKASSQKANLNLVREKLEVSQKRLNSQKSQFESAQAELDFAQSQFDRYDQLHQKELISGDQWNSYQTKLITSKKNVEALKAEVLAKEGELRQVQSELKQQKYNLQVDESKLADYSIRASFKGIVDDIPVNQGDFVNSSTKLGSLANLDFLEIKLEIPVEKVDLLKSKSYLEILNLEDQTLGKSKINFISPRVNQDSQTVLVKAIYQNKDHKLKDRQEVKTRIIWEEKRGLQVPIEAVKKEGINSFVFVLEEIDMNKYLKARKEKLAKIPKPFREKVAAQFVPKQIYLVHKTPVQLSSLQQENYTVISGLEEKDRIVFSGIEKLQDQYKAFDIKELEARQKQEFLKN